MLNIKNLELIDTETNIYQAFNDFILSNSKKTIAPSKWFGQAEHMPKNWSDIYCKNWIVI